VNSSRTAAAEVLDESVIAASVAVGIAVPFCIRGVRVRDMRQWMAVLAGGLGQVLAG
jgi:hypothetical protein